MPLEQLPPTNFKSPFSSLTGNHVAVRVPDLEEAKRWYIEKLDFRLVIEWTFGDLNLAYVAPPTDNTFYVELIGGGSPIPERPYSDLVNSLELAGYHHLCFMVESVDETLDELRNRGVKIVQEAFELQEIGRRLAFFADPWGNLLELAQILN
ncbi:MAG TPA: VOC family protein [Pyrinomonadaceae bacterium]|jgi:lactoylglutathione lyase/glyoxylase I family protein|nr:VOC family protein [Pyrinomonadaceae bacterium]